MGGRFVNETYLALAEELERLAAGYRELGNSKKVSIQDISFVLNKKMSMGKISAIKALLKKYDAHKLVEVKQEDYATFYDEAKRL